MLLFRVKKNTAFRGQYMIRSAVDVEALSIRMFVIYTHMRTDHSVCSDAEMQLDIQTPTGPSKCPSALPKTYQASTGRVSCDGETVAFRYWDLSKCVNQTKLIYH